MLEQNGVKYHQGQTQDQDPNNPVTVPATGTFQSGDVYYRFRNFPQGGTKFIEDSSVSDFFSSFTTQTGRPQILDKDSTQVFRPTAIRISNRFFIGSSINGFSSFEALNYIEVDRVIGKIQVMKLMSQSVLIAVADNRTQPFYVGSAVIKTTTGSNLISVADDILNKADTLIGQRGTQHKQSFDSYNNNAWYFDSSKGVMVRYSYNGLEDISRYGAKSYFIDKGKLNIANVISVFDPEHNNLITVFNGNDAIGFNDSVEGGKNKWVSRYSFSNAEMVGRIGNQFLSFFNGELWIHDSVTRNNFYGVQYNSKLKISANDNPSETKSFQALEEESRYVWSMTGSTPPNNLHTLGQTTRLVTAKFQKREGKWSSEILNSMTTVNRTPQDGLLNGDRMRGQYMEIELENNNTDFSELFSVNIAFIDSPLNT